MDKKIILTVILTVISVIIISSLGGYLLYNNIKTENNKKVEEVEVGKETRFYTLVNSEQANLDVSKKVVKEYLNSYENPEEENKILGLKAYEVLEIFEGRKPTYQVRYEEYKDGLLLEDYPGKNNELWAYMLNNGPDQEEKDDSGLHLYFERNENNDLVVVNAYIDTLIGSPELKFHN